MGVSEYKAIIEEHQKEMASHLRGMEHFENRFNDKIKHAKMYRTWAEVVFIVCLVLTVVVFISVLFLK